MYSIETKRLLIRPLNHDDAAFILELFNDSDFIRYIADKGVRTLDEAHHHLDTGPLASYRTHGLGLMAVELKNTGVRIGICGLIRRPSLADVDLGYAFLPQFCSQGYASEAAEASLNYGFEQLKLTRIVAITTEENQASIRLLNKLGFHFEGMIQQNDETLKLFAKVLPV